jgi:hypothetical protein
MIPDRLKKIIFRKLYDDLSHVEIIPFNNSIWFVDRDEKYWYFELQKDGTLWWRYQFFYDFFILFSLVREEFQSILAEWVEDVLNSRVNGTIDTNLFRTECVEDVLNSRVNTTLAMNFAFPPGVEDVLNSRVDTTPCVSGALQEKVDKVLNSRVLRTQVALHSTSVMAEGVLNCGDIAPTIGEGLNHKVSQAKEGELFDETIVDTVLSSLRSF